MASSVRKMHTSTEIPVNLLLNFAPNFKIRFLRLIFLMRSLNFWRNYHTKSRALFHLHPLHPRFWKEHECRDLKNSIYLLHRGKIIMFKISFGTSAVAFLLKVFLVSRNIISKNLFCKKIRGVKNIHSLGRRRSGN